MPYFLGGRGFPCRSTARDRLIVTAGSASYGTATPPPESLSSTYISGGSLAFRAPWYDDVTATRFEPSGEELWFHARYRTTTNSGNNSLLRIGVARNGTEYVSISAENSTNKLTIRVAGTVRATAASAALSLSTWERLHVQITGDDAGDQVLVYMDGDLSTPVVSYTLIGADATALSGVGKPNEFLFVNKASADDLDDLIAWDPLAAGFPGISYFVACSLADQVFTGNGAETGMAGSYTEIDERPASDTDKITASAVGQESSFTKAATTAPNVFAVQVYARVTRTGTSAGANLALKINDGTNDDEVIVPAPGDGDVSAIFETAPDGLAWSPVKYDATRIAFRSVT